MRWQKNPLFRENAGISGPPAGLAFFSSQLKAEVQKVENLRTCIHKEKRTW